MARKTTTTTRDSRGRVTSIVVRTTPSRSRSSGGSRKSSSSTSSIVGKVVKYREPFSGKFGYRAYSPTGEGKSFSTKLVAEAYSRGISYSKSKIRSKEAQKIITRAALSREKPKVVMQRKELLESKKETPTERMAKLSTLAGQRKAIRENIGMSEKKVKEAEIAYEEKVLPKVSSLYQAATYKSYWSPTSTKGKGEEIIKSFKDIQKKELKSYITSGFTPLISFPYGVKERYKLTEKLRLEAKKTKAQQKKDIKEIKKSVERIEAIGETKRIKGSPFTKKGYTQSLATYEKHCKEFNKRYGTKELEPEIYAQAQIDQKSLKARAKELEGRAKMFDMQAAKQAMIYGSEIKRLKEKGIETKREGDNLTFDSMALKTEVAPVSAKIAKHVKEEYGIVGSTTFIGGGVARTAVEAGAMGWGLGRIGTLAKLPTLISSVSKPAKVVKYGFPLVFTGTVAGVSAYGGYKTGKPLGIGKEYAIFKGLETAGAMGAFTLGGYYGTRAYYTQMQKDILAGKATKTIADIKFGKISQKNRKIEKVSGKQQALYETKFKVGGKKYKLKTFVDVDSQYIKKIGKSEFTTTTKWFGKKPTIDMPKKIETGGRIFYKGKYGKGYLYSKSSISPEISKQQIWLKRGKILRTDLDISKYKSPKFEYGESLKYKTKIFTGKAEAYKQKMLTIAKTSKKPYWIKPKLDIAITKQKIYFKEPTIITTPEGKFQTTKYLSKAKTIAAGEKYKNFMDSIKFESDIFKDVTIIPRGKAGKAAITITTPKYGFGDSILEKPTYQLLHESIPFTMTTQLKTMISPIMARAPLLMIEPTTTLAGVSQLTKTRGKTTTITKPITTTAPITTTQTKTTTITKPITTTQTKTTTITKPITTTQTKTTPITKPITTTQTKTTPITTPIFTTLPRVAVPLIPFTFSTPWGIERARKIKKPTVKKTLTYKYKPSLIATELKIKTPKIPKMFTGFGIRPIIKKKKKKKGVMLFGSYPTS